LFNPILVSHNKHVIFLYHHPHDVVVSLQDGLSHIAVYNFTLLLSFA